MKECDCDKKLPGIRMVKGNDLTVVALASVYDADSGAYIAFNLGACTGVTMRLVRSFNRIEAKSISVDGDEVIATFAGSTLTTGTYGVEILFSKDGQDGRIFENDLFAIVSDSGDASIDTAAGGGDGQGYNITVEIKSRTLRVGQVSGITDYNLLENRPSIGGVTLEGNKRPSDLGMYSKEEADGKFETKESAAEADKRVQGMLDGKVDKEPGKGLSANDLTDERAGKVDKLKIDGRANEYLNSAGIYSRPVRQGYGVSVADDNTVSVDPQVIARQSDVTSVAADLAAQKAKEQGDIDRANAAISKEETDRKAAVAALQSLIDILNSDSNVDGSVKKTVADAIARVVAGAPEDLDTLKEIADYIASDKTGAAQLAAAISQLQTPTEKHTSDIAGNASGVAENKAGVAALKTLTAGHTKSIEDLGIAKQDALVSGTNIKTINNQSILGEGNISIESGTSISVDSELSTTSENPVQNKVITTKVNSLETSLGSKASQTDLDSLSSTVTTQGQTITSIQAEIGDINTQLTEING